MGCPHAVEQDALTIGIDPADVESENTGLLNALQVTEPPVHGDNRGFGRVHLDGGQWGDRLRIPPMEKLIKILLPGHRQGIHHPVGHRRSCRLAGGPHRPAQSGLGGRKNMGIPQPGPGLCQQRGRAVQPARLPLETHAQTLSRRGVKGVQVKMRTDEALMVGDRLSSRSVIVDPLGIAAQMQGGEPQDVRIDFQRLLLRKPSHHPHKRHLVGKTQPVVSRRR